MDQMNRENSMNCSEKAFNQEQILRKCEARFDAQVEYVGQELAKIPDLRMIGLTGPSCAGKTTAAKKLDDYLEAHTGRTVHTISIDDFYYDKEILNKRAKKTGAKIDYDSEATIDLGTLGKIVSSLRQFKTVTLPHFDFIKGVREEGERITPTPNDIFFFEGIQLLYPNINALLENRCYRNIFIAPFSNIHDAGETFTPNETRLMRRLVRDFLHRGANPAFTLSLWKSVRENEEKSIFPHQHDCNYLIDSTIDCEIGLLKPYLEDLLIGVTPKCEDFATVDKIRMKISKVETISDDLIAADSIYKEFI